MKNNYKLTLLTFPADGFHLVIVRLDVHLGKIIGNDYSGRVPKVIASVGFVVINPIIATVIVR